MRKKKEKKVRSRLKKFFFFFFKTELKRQQSLRASQSSTLRLCFHSYALSVAQGLFIGPGEKERKKILKDPNSGSLSPPTLPMPLLPSNSAARAHKQRPSKAERGTIGRKASVSAWQEAH